jgi:OmpA family
MYIVEGRGLGEPLREPWRTRVGLRPKPLPLLRFLVLDGFAVNKSTLTTEHLTKLREMLVKTVEASWKTLEPIEVIRLVGHTDDTGSEKYNVGLGDRRAQAVARELAKIYPRGGRVRIVLEKSPGETQPIDDNTTTQGKAHNRRVEVFIVSRNRVPEDPPICIDPRKCVKPPPDQDPWFRPIPSGPPGKSAKDIVVDLCSRVFPAKSCGTVVEKIVDGSCSQLEKLFQGAGGTLTDKQKEELKQRCVEAASKRR